MGSRPGGKGPVLRSLHFEGHHAADFFYTVDVVIHMSGSKDGIPLCRLEVLEDVHAQVWDELVIHD